MLKRLGRVITLAWKWIVLPPLQSFIGAGENRARDAAGKEVIIRRSVPYHLLTGPDGPALKAAYKRMAQQADPAGFRVGFGIRRLFLGAALFVLGAGTLSLMFESGNLVWVCLLIGGPLTLQGLFFLMAQVCIWIGVLPNWRPVGTASRIAAGWLNQHRCPVCLFDLSTSFQRSAHPSRCSECGSLWVPPAS